MSPTSMSSPKPGDVVLVAVPFTDLSQSKKRPAVILLSRGRELIRQRLLPWSPGAALVRV